MSIFRVLHRVIHITIIWTLDQQSLLINRNGPPVGNNRLDAFNRGPWARHPLFRFPRRERDEDVLVSASEWSWRGHCVDNEWSLQYQTLYKHAMRG